MTGWIESSRKDLSTVPCTNQHGIRREAEGPTRKFEDGSLQATRPCDLQSPSPSAIFPDDVQSNISDAMRGGKAYRLNESSIGGGPVDDGH